MRNNGNYNGINYNGRLAKTLDLLNADGLDDSITEVYESEEENSNAIGYKKWRHPFWRNSSADGSENEYEEESDEDTSGFLTELIAGNKQKKILKGITGCKKPLIMIGKKKKAYNECLENYKSSVQDAKRAAEVSGMETASKQAELDAVKKQLEDLKNTPVVGSASREAASSEMQTVTPKKFLGMPKAVGITVVSVVGAGLLGLGAYFIFRKK